MRCTADGTLDTAWGNGGRVTYSEAKTDFTLPAVIALSHKQIFLALGREQQRGDADNYYGPQGGADDVAIVKLDSRGRYDRTFNNGHALTVASGTFHEADSLVGVDQDFKIVEDYTAPTFGDLQFFADGSFRVVNQPNAQAERREARVFDHPFF